MRREISTLILILAGKMSQGITIGLNELLDLGPPLLPILFVSDSLHELLKFELCNHLLLLLFLLVFGVHGRRELHSLNGSRWIGQTSASHVALGRHCLRNLLRAALVSVAVVVFHVV